MSPYIPCTRYLEPTQITMLSEAAPALLTVTDGTLWLTRGDGEEVILAAGDCAEIDTGDRPVASVLGRCATVKIAAAGRDAWARAA